MLVEPDHVGLAPLLYLEAGGEQHALVPGGVEVEPLAVTAGAVQAEEGELAALQREAQLYLVRGEEVAARDTPDGLQAADGSRRWSRRLPHTTTSKVPMSAGSKS